MPLFLVPVDGWFCLCSNHRLLIGRLDANGSSRHCISPFDMAALHYRSPGKCVDFPEPSDCKDILPPVPPIRFRDDKDTFLGPRSGAGPVRLAPFAVNASIPTGWFRLVGVHFYDGPTSWPPLVPSRAARPKRDLSIGRLASCFSCERRVAHWNVVTLRGLGLIAKWYPYCVRHGPLRVRCFVG